MAYGGYDPKCNKAATGSLHSKWGSWVVYPGPFPSSLQSPLITLSRMRPEPWQKGGQCWPTQGTDTTPWPRPRPVSTPPRLFPSSRIYSVHVLPTCSPESLVNPSLLSMLSLTSSIQATILSFTCAEGPFPNIALHHGVVIVLPGESDHVPPC